jgi:hypothetical protein
MTSADIINHIEDAVQYLPVPAGLIVARTHCLPICMTGRLPCMMLWMRRMDLWLAPDGI